MKNSTKFLVAILFIATIAKSASAQTNMSMSNMDTQSGWRLGIGLEGALPTQTIYTYSKVMFGGTLRLQYNNPSSNVIYTLTSGYYNFYVNKSNFSTPTTTLGSYTYGTAPHSLGVIPVKLGVKGFVSKSIYLMGEAGVGFETSYNLDKKLIIAPSIGWASSAIDLSVRYESLSGQDNNYGLVGLRLAYGFGL